MKKINFVKYNKTRREAFQIRTSLVEEEGCPFVEKTALRPEGAAHIKSLGEKYKSLTAQSQKLKVAGVSISRMRKPPVSISLKVRPFPSCLEGRSVTERFPYPIWKTGFP